MLDDLVAKVVKWVVYAKSRRLFQRQLFDSS